MSRRGTVRTECTTTGVEGSESVCRQDSLQQSSEQVDSSVHSSVYWLDSPESFGHDTSNSSIQKRISYRPLCPEDYQSLKAGHEQNFPINYEAAFFEKAVEQGSAVISWAAVQRQAGHDALSGFITARYFKLHECDPTDRAAMGLGSRLLDAQEVVYILTLGVAERARRRGVAGQMLRLVLTAARSRGCRACFLHVITHNHAAISFYLAQAFSQLAQLRDFYYIASGRQLDPVRFHYDAFLFARQLNAEGPLSAMDYINTALIPFRSLVDGWAGACSTWMQPARPRRAPPSLLQQATTTPRHQPAPQQGSWLHGLFARHRMNE